MGNNYTEQVKSRVKIIRLRTWTLTLTTVTLLVLYIFVTLSIKAKIDLIDFAITAAIQISTHFAYFSDGERYGELDDLFIKARKGYNAAADRIMAESTVERLREYCEFEYEERKALYIADACGKIGISVGEFERLSQKPVSELKVIEKYEHDGKVVYFTKSRRKALIRLVYGKNPVKANSPDTILSAVDRHYTEAIKDGSQKYRKTTHATRFFKSIIVGGILAYIGYNLRGGLSFAAVIKSSVFIGSMITAAVSSYIAGEKSTREYKRKFYKELLTFIGKFFSWTGVPAEKEAEEKS